MKLTAIYCNVDTLGLSKGQTVKKGEVISHVNNRRQEMEYKESLPPTFYDKHVKLIDNNSGYDYLNITCYSSTHYTQIIDPEIILSLSNKGENSETE